MKLLIDAGNSFIKCLLISENQKESVQAPTRDYQSFLSGLLKNCKPCDSIIVSSVVTDQFTDWLICEAQARGLPRPQFVRVLSEYAGISIAYSEPSALGVDRFLAMIAAFDKIKAAVIVVDIGTAITIDAIDEWGKHLGGVIIPGWDQMARCLGDVTEHVGVKAGSVRLWGKNTGDAVTGGCFYSALAGIQKVTQLMSMDMKSDPALVLTGGGAQEFYSELGGDFQVYENLVLEGLEIVANKT